MKHINFITGKSDAKDEAKDFQAGNTLQDVKNDFITTGGLSLAGQLI